MQWLETTLPSLITMLEGTNEMRFASMDDMLRAARFPVRRWSKDDAGIEDADLFIACAPLDETNLVACKVAHDLFNVTTTIARMRSPEYPNGAPLLGKEGGFAVDHVICPEESVTSYVRKLIEYPEALQVIEFAGGLVSLIAVRAARVLSGPEASLLSLLEVIFGVAWAWLGTTESPTLPVLGGGALVLGALEKHPLFLSATLPKKVFPPMFNRYGEGMGFEDHVDNAIRRDPVTGRRLRTDL